MRFYLGGSPVKEYRWIIIWCNSQMLLWVLLSAISTILYSSCCLVVIAQLSKFGQSLLIDAVK
jgi:hypothetical protein